MKNSFGDLELSFLIDKGCNSLKYFNKYLAVTCSNSN